MWGATPHNDVFSFPPGCQLNYFFCCETVVISRTADGKSIAPGVVFVAAPKVGDFVLGKLFRTSYVHSGYMESASARGTFFGIDARTFRSLPLSLFLSCLVCLLLCLSLSLSGSLSPSSFSLETAISLDGIVRTV